MNLFNRSTHKALLIWVVAAFSSAVSAQDVSIKNVSVSSTSSEEVMVSLEMSGTPPKPQQFTIDKPARISLDFLGTKNESGKKNVASTLGSLTGISVVDTNDRTRVVLKLTRLVEYTTTTEGNTFNILLSQKSTESASANQFNVSNQASVSGDSTIESVDFQRGDKGEGRLLINLSNPNAQSEVRQEGNKIILDVFDTSLPKELVQLLDVTDFGTPTKAIEAFPTDKGARFTLTASGLYENTSYQADGLLAVELRPLTQQEADKLKRENLVFTGERLSLNFQDIEVRSVLQLLADFTGKNIVISDTVGGSLTLRLKNVPWDQALDIILRTRGLTKRENGNVMFIAPSTEVVEQEKTVLEAERAIDDLAPLRTEYIRLNYISAQQFANVLAGEGSKGGEDAKSASILSPRGHVIWHEATNTLIIKDTAEVLDNVRSIIEKIDIPLDQVLIESRIVVATTDFARDLGMRWGYTRQSVTDDGDQFVVGGTQSAGSDLSAPGLATSEGLLVDLGRTATSSIGFAIGQAGSALLQLELSAQEVDGNAEVLSNPRVVTTNLNAATIERGVEIPYQTVDADGQVTTSFKEAVLKLEVTPLITPDKTIRMDLKINKDSQGENTAAGPAIDTNKLETTVSVKNGETVILGGIFEEVKSEAVTKVPLLGDLPIVGYAFRNNSKVSSQNELLIFITPKILSSTLGQLQ